MISLRVEPDHLVVVADESAPRVRLGRGTARRPAAGRRQARRDGDAQRRAVARQAVLSRSDRRRSRRHQARPPALVRPGRAADARRAGRRSAPRALGRAHRRHRCSGGARARPGRCLRRCRAATSIGASRFRTTAIGPGAAWCRRSSSGRTRGIPPTTWPIRVAAWSPSPANIPNPRSCARRSRHWGYRKR